LKRKNKYFPPVKCKNQFNFQELFPAIHCNLLLRKLRKRISVAIRASLTFASPQKLQKGVAAESALKNEKSG